MGIHTAIPLPPALAFIMHAPTAPRVAIERVIQAAIDALDAIDGDIDMEDDDPAGDASEQDAGSDDGRTISPVLPRWGVDQSRGPINAGEPERQLMIEELGLVRTPGGGWRLPS